VKYVTFYWSIMGGVQHVEKFATEADALRNFRANYRSYFDLSGRFLPRKTPCAYGFPHRKYYCMSIRDFKKNFPEESKKGGAK